MPQFAPHSSDLLSQPILCCLEDDEVEATLAPVNCLMKLPGLLHLHSADPRRRASQFHFAFQGGKLELADYRYSRLQFDCSHNLEHPRL